MAYITTHTAEAPFYFCATRNVCVALELQARTQVYRYLTVSTVQHLALVTSLATHTWGSNQK